MSAEALTAEKPVVQEAGQTSLAATMAELGRKARDAAAELALASPEAKATALQAAARAVRGRQNEILAANAEDVAAAKATGISAALIDRLALDPKRLEGVAKGLEDIAAQPDPVGKVLAHWTRPNGLNISRISVPLGIIGIIYEPTQRNRRRGRVGVEIG
jgi:glutamate-5-semialdehyde dehydrogenase